MLTNGEAAVIAVVLHDTDAHAAPADAEERLHSFSALFLLLNKSAHRSELGAEGAERIERVGHVCTRRLGVAQPLAQNS